MKIRYLFALILLLATRISYSETEHKPSFQPVELPVNVIDIINHDPVTFTQGLFYDGNVRFESSGLYGQSFIRRFDKNSQQTHRIAPRYFAEGITIIGDTLYLLTWKAETLLLFDKNTLQPKGSRNYQGQGWGLTHNDEHFIMSNGSNRLSFRDKDTFALEKTVIVPGLDKLNELEYVNGIIWANRWYDDNIYAISEKTGCMIGFIDASRLRQQADAKQRDNVTNGIAYQPAKNALLITGKRWSKQFYIELPELDVDTFKPCR